MTFADKCILLGLRRERHAAPAGDNKLGAALLPRG